jgi:hypothetical protein
MRSAGFRHVGFGQCSAFLTYHGPPEILNVFLHDQMSAYATVRRQPIPELDRLVGISIQTEFPSGEILVNTNMPLDKLFASTRQAIEALANVSIGDMTRRHAERIAARAPVRSVQEQTPNGALALHLEEMRWMRDLFRSRGWTVATPDPTRVGVR